MAASNYLRRDWGVKEAVEEDDEEEEEGGGVRERRRRRRRRRCFYTFFVSHLLSVCPENVYLFLSWPDQSKRELAFSSRRIHEN